MKKNILLIISILLILSLSLAGCSKGSNPISDDNSLNTSDSTRSSGENKGVDQPSKKENPFTRSVSVSAEIINETAYLPYFEEQRIITIDNVEQALMTPDRKHIVYLDTAGDLYFSDPDLASPVLLVGDSTIFCNSNIIGDYYYFVSCFNNAPTALYRYNYVEDSLEMLLEIYTNQQATYSLIGETDTEFQFYTISQQTAELELLGTYSKELLGDRTYCSEQYSDADTDSRLWLFSGNSGYTALAYENGELYCLAEDLLNEGEEPQAQAVLRLYSSNNCAAIIEGGERGGRVFVKRPNEEIITFSQEDCYFTPIAYWFHATEDGGYVIGADHYVGLTQTNEGSLYLYWLGNDGTMQRVEEISREIDTEQRGDCLSFSQMEFLDDHTLIYFDENGFLHKAKLDQGTVTGDQLLLEDAARECQTVSYDGGECALITMENGDVYFLHSAEDTPINVGMDITLEGVSVDGDYVYLLTEFGALYAFNWSEMKSHADDSAGLANSYGDYTPIAVNVVPESLKSGLAGGLLDPNAFMFQNYEGADAQGFKYYNGTSTELLCTVSY